ncbi:high affinity cGMP-specific 3',5'-cyclic phosphodiesterase 9A-like [Lytechinus pictus]|uniref:high affinity cGMP-specific 3',5'-cyclic phosphodiesterase 9A-like n=1 Tax=Lytechinus pictus TaxID=7653 RepID=UPI0030BA2475
MGNGASYNKPRTIYLDLDGRIEKIIFSTHCGSRDIHDLLTSAAGVSRWATIALKDQQGALVSIAPTMPINTTRDPYKVVVTQNRPGEGNRIG